FFFNSLYTLHFILSHQSETHLLSFHSFAHSLRKTPGCHPERNLRLSTFYLQFLCKSCKIRTYGRTQSFNRDCPQADICNSFRIGSYIHGICKCFRIRTCEKNRGGATNDGRSELQCLLRRGTLWAARWGFRRAA